MSDPDPNTEAHRVAAQAGPEDQPASPELEAAWEAWSKQIKQVDRRGIELLRAAFEAGWEAGSSVSASELGRRGGIKGGKARSDKLTSEQRSAIARKAAEIRWQRKNQ